MTPNSPAYQKLQRLERLLKLKERLAQEKQTAQEFLIELTQPLLEEGKLANIDINLDQPMADYLTRFDLELHKINQELLQIAD